MTLQTKLPGSLIQSGSVPVSAITNFTGQLTASLPSGTVSSSAQVKTLLPTDTVSSSVQVTAFLPTNVVSSSNQVTAFLPANTVSGSTQIDITQTTNYTTFSSSLATVDATQTDRLTSIENVTGSYATTGSNTFVGIQAISDTTNSTSYLDGALTVAGGMSVRKDVRVSGSLTVNGLLTAVSMSTLYVTASEYTIGTSKIILNDDDLVRFAGLSIVDSGSASPATASIFWDSLKHKFIYENLSGSGYNSAMFIAGPKNTGSLGDEVGLTSGYIPVATGDDHIDNSVMYQSGSSVGIGITNPSLGTLQVNGNVHANTLTISGTAGASIARINATQDQSILSFTDTQDNTGYFGIRSAVEADEQGASFYADGALFFGRLIGGSFTERVRIDSSGNVGVGTTSPGGKLQVNGQVRIINGSGNNPGGYLWIEDQNGLTYSATSENTPSLTVKNEQSGANRVSTLRLAARDSGGGVSNWNISSIGVGSNRGILAIQNGTDERLRIDSLGNIGIGTNAPTELIELNKADGAGDIAIRFHTPLVTEYIIGMDDTTNKFFITNNGSGTKLGTNADGIVIDTVGNVGIKTASPSSPLSVNGNIDAIALSVYSSSAADGGVYIDKQSGSPTRLGRISSFGIDSGLTFWTNNAGVSYERIRIRGDGNVGIGTTNVIAKLHVAGTHTDIRGATAIFGSSNTSNNGLNGAVIIGSDPTGSLGYFESAGTNSGLTFWTNSGGTAIERMRIDFSGNILISTTSTTVWNGVAGTKFIVGGSNNTIVSLQSSTTTINQGVILEGLSSAVTSNSKALGSIAFLRENTSTTALNSYTAFYTNNSGTVEERVRITSAGNVGIGTTNPSQRLHLFTATVPATDTYSSVFMESNGYGYVLRGGIKQNEGDRFVLAQYNGGSLVDRIIVNHNGNVGIGTTNPVTTLHIGGSNGKLLVVNSGTPTGTYNAAINAHVDTGTTGIQVTVGNAYSYFFANSTDILLGSNQGITGQKVKISRSAADDSLIVNSSGHVLTANQPRFYVSRTSSDQTGYNATSTGDVVVIYNSVNENVGNHYSTTTGKFTAPVAGMYAFSASVYSNGTTFGQVWLVVNGSRKLGTDIVYQVGASSEIISGTWIIYLAANDTVGVHPYNGSASSVTIYANSYHTWFKGYLIG